MELQIQEIIEKEVTMSYAWAKWCEFMNNQINYLDQENERKRGVSN